MLFRSVQTDRLPSEAFYQQCFIAFESDEVPTFRQWDRFEDVGIWSSDAYHHDGADSWSAMRSMTQSGVPEAVQRAKDVGFRCLWVPTSCEMILATRDATRFAQLQKLFPGAIEDKGHRNYLYGWTLYARETISYHFNRMLGRE